jgi:hypothetical protein
MRNPVFPVNKYVEGFKVANADAVVADSRLCTALDLYCAHFTEVSENAKLLTLAMAMECLTVRSDKHSVALALIDRWEAEIDEEMDSYGVETEERAALESLKKQLIFRRETSIRQLVRELIRSTFSDENPEELRRLASTSTTCAESSFTKELYLAKLCLKPQATHGRL